MTKQPRISHRKLMTGHTSWSYPAIPASSRSAQCGIRSQLALETLENAFALAQKQYEALARNAYETITLAVGETLQRRFGVGWGDRLERQIQDYVPVVKAVAALLVKQSITLLQQSSSERSEVAMTIAPNMSRNCGTRSSLV